MSTGTSKSPSEDYFNDLSQQPNDRNQSSQSPPERRQAEGDGWVPRPKRIACVVCRKRKLRCDGNKPSCGTCARLGHECAYDEVRRKSGPKRGYVKQLEARLAQVETLLKTQDPPEPVQTSSTAYPDPSQSTLQHGGPFQGAPNISLSASDVNSVPQMLSSAFGSAQSEPMIPDPSLGIPSDDEFSWEMIGLGLDEPLPTQEVIDEMHQIYFEKIHASNPMIHRPRYLAAMNLAPHMRPPICLRYAMWTLACSITPKYFALQEHFYQRARKYAEHDEMKGHGESMITIAHSQCWILIASYEFKMMYFPRAWLSTGRATRLAQMMGLHRQDGVGLDVKQCLSPPRDWTEREERRRTFWVSFCQDRYASIGTGWPMTIDEKDILTNLPTNEDAFEKSKPQRTLPLSEVLSTEGASTLSPFAGVVLMACLFGRNLTHLHRPDTQDNDHDLNGEFWKRHRALDNILLNTSLSLPSHLRLPSGLTDSNIVFCNMNIHTSTICLHQAAIFKADKNRMPAQISAESKRRCIIAADQITNIMKMISHIDLSTMNPFIAFCLYVAARVFVQYLKSRPDDPTVRSSLQFLLSAMQALKGKNPLTESFLVQLDVDLEGSGLDNPHQSSKFSFGMKKGVAEIPVNTDSIHCSPLIDIRQSQNGPGVAIIPSEPESGSQRPLQTTDGIPLDFGQASYNQQFSANASLPNRQKSTSRQANLDDCVGKTVRILGLFPESDFRETMGQGDPMNHGTVDMDLSPDATTGSDRHHSASDHPTPSTSSNKASSHTSYTPPNLDDAATHSTSNSYTNASSAPSMSPSTAAYFQNAHTFGQFFSPPPDTVGKDSIGSSNPFSMQGGWEYPVTQPGGQTGMTPGATTGMSPMGEGQWTQMLEGMVWNGWTAEPQR